MTANEAAAAVQAGKTGYLELWEAVRRFAHDRAYRWAAALNGLGGVTVEDLEQCAFLALMKTVEGWDASKGAFLTLYGLRLKTAFSEAAGLRTQRTRRDPLQAALSLDAPLTDDDGDSFSLADIVLDPAAETAIEAAALRDFQQRRHKTIEVALAAIPVDQRAAVVGRHYYGRKVDMRAYNAGLRALRYPSVARGPREFL